MKSIQKITGIFMAVAAIIALSGTAGFAKIATQSSFSNADLILLTDNHARTIAFSLDSPAGGAGGLHAIYLLNVGNSTGSQLILNFVNNTALRKGQEVIYFVTGLIAPTLTTTPIAPVLQYVYSTGGTLSLAVPVPMVSGGILFVGILYSTSGVEYPMTMIVTAALQPLA
jgi:hypothetical protein